MPWKHGSRRCCSRRFSSSSSQTLKARPTIRLQHLPRRRLVAEVVGAQRDGADRMGAILVPGDHDDLGVGGRARMSSSVARPSEAPSASGGSPRSSVTTGGRNAFT